MLREEFEKRTGIYPPQNLYNKIEETYMDYSDDKDSFCNAYAKNINGLAEKIQQESNTTELKLKADISRMVDEYKGKIQNLKSEIEKIKEELEKEQEWKPYESTQNVPQEDYEKLAEGAEFGKNSHYMSDAEAIQWICGEFDFVPSKIKIIHEIDEYKINRHNHIKKTGKKIDRRPVYCATDYYYIRFNTTRWYYEATNGQLQPFYD
jgi:hypothetical protein